MTQKARLKHERPWTTAEIGILRRDCALGAAALARILDRSEGAIRSAAKRHRISLRRKGERRGLLLGQPRGQRWDPRLDSIREEALAGTIDIAALEERARGLARKAPRCPVCGVRPQERASTGFCEVCHTRALADSYRTETALREARREHWRVRQEASRERRSDEPE